MRADPLLRDLPVILLSARAGEEARVEGLDAGADDYLVKPFTARELLARVRSNLEYGARCAARRLSRCEKRRVGSKCSTAPAWRSRPNSISIGWCRR